MKTTYEEVIINVLSPLDKEQAVQILNNLITEFELSETKIFLPDEIVEGINTRIKTAINSIFSLIEEDVIFLSLNEIVEHLLQNKYQKQYVKRWLNKNDYKVAEKTGRILMPRITSNGIFWAAFCGRYYTLQRVRF